MAGTSNRDYTSEDLVGGQIRSKSDKKVNQRAQEYNRAAVTISQKKKEQELQAGFTANMMMQQQMAMEKAKLLDLAQKIDMQTRITDNKLMMLEQQQQAQQAPPPIPFAGNAIPQDMMLNLPQQEAPIDPAVAQMMQGAQDQGQGVPPTEVSQMQQPAPAQMEQQPAPF